MSELVDHFAMTYKVTSYLLNGNILKRKLVTVNFPKGSYLGTANVEDIKTTDIVIAQRNRMINSDNVSSVIASYCEQDGILTLTTDIPSSVGLTMSVFVLYGSII